MYLSEFFETVYRPRRLRGKSENSNRLYRLCIRQFGITLGRNPTIADLTEANVLNHLARRSDVAPATRNKELAELSALWRFATQRGMHTGWPDIDDEHEPERAPIAWMPEEIHSLFRAIARLDGSIDGISEYRWWSGFVRVCLDTGERVSAIRVARWSWVQGEWLLVPAEARKGKTRDRRYRLSDSTIQSLSMIREQSTAKIIFPWPLNGNYLWRKFGDIVESAGLPNTRKHKFHALRKTTGSAVYAAGLDPQDVLDHSDRRTTKRYLDPRFSRKQQACDVVSEFLENPPKRKRKSG